MLAAISYAVIQGPYNILKYPFNCGKVLRSQIMAKLAGLQYYKGEIQSSLNYYVYKGADLQLIGLNIVL